PRLQRRASPACSLPAASRQASHPLRLCRFVLWLRDFCAFFSSRRHQAVLRGFLAVEDGAAGTANGDAGFDLFGADGAIRQRLGIVKPRLFQSELASGAALEVGDEHGIFGALPFEIGGGDQAALKFLEAVARISKRRCRAGAHGSDEDAVETSLPR